MSGSVGGVKGGWFLSIPLDACQSRRAALWGKARFCTQTACFGFLVPPLERGTLKKIGVLATSLFLRMQMRMIKMPVEIK